MSTSSEDVNLQVLRFWRGGHTSPLKAQWPALGCDCCGSSACIEGTEIVRFDSEKCDDRGPVGSLIWSAQKCVSRKRHGKRRSMLSPRNSLKPRRLPDETPPAARRRCTIAGGGGKNRGDVTGAFALRQGGSR